MDTITRSTTNMATTHLLHIIKPPERFSIEDDAEKFCDELQNYFEMLQTPKEQHNLLLPAFLSPELIDRYKRAAKAPPDDWQTAFAKAFKKSATLEQKLQEALNFKKDDLPVEDFLEKVEKMTDAIMKFKLDRTTIFQTVLLAALNDPEMKKEVITKADADVSTIKTNLIAVEEIRRQVEPERTYAQVLSRPIQKTLPVADKTGSVPAPSYNRNSFNNRSPVRCFNCYKEGHISRNCREKAVSVRERVD